MSGSAAADGPVRTCRKERIGYVLAVAAFSILLSALAASPAPAATSRISGELDAAGLRGLLAGHRGRVVLLNFWATWCVPCREEFPDLVRLQKDLAPRGLQIVGVSTDFASQTAAVESFLASMKPNFDNYRKKSGGDEQAFIEAVDGKWGGELPFSVLYDREGRKARVLSGKHTLAQYRTEILKLLGPGDGRR